MYPEYLVSKVMAAEELAREAARWRLKDDRVVMVHGLFDGLTAAEVSFIASASDEGHRVIAAVPADEAAPKAKQNARQRAMLLAALVMVDAVIIYNAPSPEAEVRLLQPEVLALVEGDPAAKKLTDAVNAYGGKVMLKALKEEWPAAK